MYVKSTLVVIKEFKPQTSKPFTQDHMPRQKEKKNKWEAAKIQKNLFGCQQRIELRLQETFVRH